jgi:NAD(P)-dependent dehydrogenase (short-subunit alcohol dehydrogenase family)
MPECVRSHVVVTGASSGIGRATTLRLAAAGHHVYAGVRRLADAPATDLAAGGEITPLMLDVTEPAQVEAAAATVAAHTGADPSSGTRTSEAGLDGLVNNAGIGLFGSLEIIPIDQFRRELEVNVTGQLAVTQAFLPLLRRARGRIVLIGSIGSRFTPPFTGPIAASKSAIATMAEALRQELAPWDIRVILVEPASINTAAGGKLGRDAERLITESGPGGRALYEPAFRRFTGTFLAREQTGSPPDAVARVITRALTARRPRACYLAGKDSRWMAVVAALLPAPVADRLRRKVLSQPAPGSQAAPLPTPGTRRAA